MAAFSPEGRRVITASLDRTVRVWNAFTGEAMTQPLTHDGPVAQACFSPDGQRILTNAYYAARLWDSTTGRPLTEWLNAGIPMCFDSTGHRIATAGSVVRVLDVLPVTTPVPRLVFDFRRISRRHAIN
jgi:WD40 repeat protein